MNENKNYLRRKQMAKHLSVSERHLSDLVSRRIIPCIKLGHRTVLFDPTKVEQALNRFEQREMGREARNG
jgi:excisionase family DNA binding protein